MITYIMIISVKQKGVIDIFHGHDSKAARKILGQELHHKARVILTVLNSMQSCSELNCRSLHLEHLKGNRKGEYSIRINKQYRICFNWDGNNVSNVEIIDYH